MGDKYRLLIEARLDSQTLNAEIKNREAKGVIIKARIDSQSKTDILKFLDGLQAKGNTIGKIKFFEADNGEINKVLIDYTNSLGQAEQRWVSINDSVNYTHTRTVDLAKIEKELLSIQTKSENLTAKQTDEMDRMALSAEKFLEKSKSMNQSPSVKAATDTAKAMLSAVTEGDINKVRELNRQFQINKAALEGSKTTVRSWGEGLKHAMVQTIEYSLTIGALHAALAQLRQGLQYVVDLNKELVSIQVIQAEGAKTPEEIANLATRYNDLAMELGATTIEVAKGSLEWLRQGKTISETNELLRSTMALSKLGNLESAESTEYLTSILNGFNKEAKEAEDVVDKLVAVDNRAATSAGRQKTPEHTAMYESRFGIRR